MIVVSNASPLAALSFIHQVELLRQLYAAVWVPAAVWDEVAVAGGDQPGRGGVLQASWIERHAVTDRQLVTALLQDLGPGESEAIALAVQVKADLLIMDERLGRRTARHLGLNVIGVVGVLVEAKRRGLVSRVKLYLDQLRDIAGFRISDELYNRVLEDQGEAG